MYNRKCKAKIISLSLALLLVISTIGGFMSQSFTAEAADTDIIEISNEDELISFANSCRNDSYSFGRKVKLTSDISITKDGFEGIAYFNGTFDGGNHTIRNLNKEYIGSDYGFFRYLGEDAYVYNLSVSGTITASGSQKNIGGIAGVNYGTISNCAYVGKLSGGTAAGGIAGVNKAGARLINCNSDADISATNQTGGIAGNNQGIISGCISRSKVNINELNSSFDIGGVDVGTLNITQHVVDRNDMGGIAGYSTGVISDSTNYGAVGYSHMGYNAGGIVGNQKGKVYNCTNEGSVYGRKDVGGIVGQAQPYIESEYLNDRVNQLSESVDSIGNIMSGLSSSIGDTSAEVSGYVESLTEKYKENSEIFAESIKDVSDTIEKSSPDADKYIDNINAALDKISEIQGDDIILSDKQKDDINEQWKIIRANMTNLVNSMTDTTDSIEDFIKKVSDQLSKEDAQSDINGIADSIQNQMNIIADSIDGISAQINSIGDITSDTINTLIDKEDHIEDISAADNAKSANGVVFECVNRGDINGDINAGGVAGTMNIEYDVNPEYDLDLSSATNVKLRTTVNVVVMNCINYADITVKKNCAGGITGLQELGLVYGCEGYGDVKSETGDYAGGIAGKSESSISDSYSLCNVEAANYAGGISGLGYTVKNCITIPDITCDGEAKGSVLGINNSGGELADNLFVNDKYGGIDNISYRGKAEQVTYEYIMSLEAIPEGFNQVVITFKADSKVLGSKKIPYNSSLREKDFPYIPAKDGCYAQWPSDAIQTPITHNKVIEVEYHYWVESIAGNIKSSNNKSLFLVEGRFYGDDEMVMGQCDISGLHGNVEYAYSWQLQGSHNKAVNTVIGHFYITDTSGSNEVWYKDKDNNAWVKADTNKNGSYITAEIPYQADFAVIHKKTDVKIYYVIGAAAIIIVLAGIVIIRKKKKIVV